MTDWTNRTCEDCVFRVHDECRRFPPVIRNDIWDTTAYVRVTGESLSMPACAEHRSYWCGYGKGHDLLDRFRALSRMDKFLLCVALLAICAGVGMLMLDVAESIGRLIEWFRTS